MKTQSIVLIMIIGTIVTIAEAQKFGISKPFANLSTKQHSAKHASPVERRKLGLFPKSIKKFVITEKPIKRVEITSQMNYVTAKKPIMPKMSLKHKRVETTTTAYTYRKPVTRQPLMKFTKFVIESPRVERITIESPTTKSYRIINFDPFRRQSINQFKEDLEFDSISDKATSLENIDDDNMSKELDKSDEYIEDDEFTTDEPNEEPGMENNVIKKPLMSKMLFNTKVEATSYSYRKPITRKPLMKFKKFTVEPITTQGTKFESFSENQSEEDLEFDDISGDESSAENVSEANKDEEPEISDEDIDDNEFTTETEPIEISELENNTLIYDKYNSVTTEPYGPSLGEDYDEFISVKEDITKSNETQNTGSDQVTDDIDFEAQVTTDIYEDSSIIKRSINVIEEENLGTTISGFKFTGRESRLTDNLAYRNINS